MVMVTYLLLGTTVLVEIWPPHVFCVRFRDEFLQGGGCQAHQKPPGK
jgi:hypothetical protein